MKKEFLLLISLSALAALIFFVFPVSKNQETDPDVSKNLLNQKTEVVETLSSTLIEKKKLTFDVIRITPQGDAVMAGKTETNIKISIFDSDEKLASVFSDPNGEWVWVSTSPLKKGIKKLFLVHNDENGIVHESDEKVMIFLEGKNDKNPIVAKFLDSDGENVKVYNKKQLINGLSVDFINYLPNSKIKISGHFIPSKKVDLYHEDKLLGKVIADEFGEWVFTFDVKPYLGTFDIDVISRVGEKKLILQVPISIEDKNIYEGKEFVVEQGNSLWRIARKTLGGGIYYTEIFKNNSTKISDPNLIFPGQVFIIPKINNVVNYER